ncbi:hypothetical protein [Pseudoclavibacter helvolus]|uniref:hypothetical protein n=1 Tax=Pseudoclavibacter helvolus TaxID=255205 RepID=UPI0024AE4975|nr:hypothetical protein [Pseudoclavibacter helvolus]
MITSTEILGTEEHLLQRNSRAAAVHEAVAARGRAAVIALNARYDAESGETALEQLDIELEAVIGRSLDEYVKEASGLFSAEELALWTAKITRVSGSYVGRAAAVGVPTRSYCSMLSKKRRRGSRTASSRSTTPLATAPSIANAATPRAGPCPNGCAPSAQVRCSTSGEPRRIAC